MKTFDNLAEFVSVCSGQSVPGGQVVLLKNTTTQPILPGDVVQIARFRIQNGDIVITETQVVEPNALVMEA